MSPVQSSACILQYLLILALPASPAKDPHSTQLWLFWMPQEHTPKPVCHLRPGHSHLLLSVHMKMEACGLQPQKRKLIETTSYFMYPRLALNSQQSSCSRLLGLQGTAPLHRRTETFSGREETSCGQWPTLFVPYSRHTGNTKTASLSSRVYLVFRPQHHVVLNELPTPKSEEVPGSQVLHPPMVETNMASKLSSPPARLG